MEITFCYRCHHETMVVNGKRGCCSHCGKTYGPHIAAELPKPIALTPDICPVCHEERVIPWEANGPVCGCPVAAA